MGVYFKLEKAGQSQSGKTDIYVVRSRGGSAIGEIRWFAAWRKYCLFPMAGTIFDEFCLAELSKELNELTEKKNRKGEEVA